VLKSACVGEEKFYYYLNCPRVLPLGDISNYTNP
jgi:hypothetical protein